MLVVIAIILTLFIGRPLAKLLGPQDLRAIFFLIGMLFVGAMILVHALKGERSGLELTLVLGIIAVYIMFFLRLGLAERSHLIEYSVLAILIHMALLERQFQGKAIWSPALLAIGIAFSIGVLDECSQLIIPDRVFDPVDIFFNGMVIVAAIGFYVLLNWVRKKIRDRKNEKS